VWNSEDYSPDGAAWNYFLTIMLVPCAYPGEKMGLPEFLIITKDYVLIALWNGEDPILKERILA